MRIHWYFITKRGIAVGACLRLLLLYMFGKQTHIVVLIQLHLDGLLYPLTFIAAAA